jgi:site-specific recombinase XerD
LFALSSALGGQSPGGEGPSKVIKSIDKYIHMERRRSGAVKASGTVFVGRTGQPLKTPAVNRVFSTNCKRTGLHIWPHMLRHAYAVERLAYGME